MGSKLLIRSYNVGCGDCFYVRIPDPDNDFHILIDCGSKEGASTGVMESAIKHMEEQMLPDDASGKKRLDLIVVTHRHEDHIKGFNPEFFSNIAVKNIWLTAAMDESHEQAEKSFKLHNFAKEQIKTLDESGAALSPELNDLVALYGINNDDAVETLTKTLPQENGIQPVYVYAGQSSDDYGLDIKDTKIFVLGPEQDIDGYYLGKDADENLRGLIEAGDEFQKAASVDQNYNIPKNISASDFRVLQSRLLSNGLAFAVDDSSIQNNVSTVLLIEWNKRRLLFVGDAEWNSRYRKNKKNCSWNVMWKERNDMLSKPLDFLKAGHHGSHNATPWNRHADTDHEVNQIFNAILPLPKAGESATAKCIVSTKRKQYDTIPDAELLTEIGKRVANTREYLTEFEQANNSGFDPDEDIFNYSIMKTYSKEPSPRQVGEKDWLDKPQPFRTDMESAGKGQGQMLSDVEFVDVEIDPPED